MIQPFDSGSTRPIGLAHHRSGFRPAGARGAARGWIQALVVGVGFSGFVALAAAHEPTAADIQLLRDAASALQPSNPELARGLTEMADREAAELEQPMNNNDERGEEDHAAPLAPASSEKSGEPSTY